MSNTIAPIALGDTVLDPPVVLAPMSGVSDRPFRRLVRRLGGGLVVTEMIASEEMVRAAARRLRSSTELSDERPISVQLAGHDPAIMAEAATLNVERGATAIDINFGCPVKKVVSKLCGSALMREPELARSIMAAVVRAVDVPVTVKMRLGWDEGSVNAPDLARAAEDLGLAMVTVHGRTRSQLYSGSADWWAVGQVVGAVEIPVLVNGDLGSTDAVDEALRQSGAAGVMVGRATYGRPWLVGQVCDHLAGRTVRPDPDHDTRRSIVIEHYGQILDHYGVEAGVTIARKHLAWYAHGLTGAAVFRSEINSTRDPARVVDAVERLFDGRYLGERRMAA